MARSLKKILLSALHSAIAWEESLLDADVFMDNKKEIAKCKRQIKDCEMLLDWIDKNRPMTLKEYLNYGVKSGELKMVKLSELLESSHDHAR